MELDFSGAKVYFTLPIDFPILGELQISETMVVSWIVMLVITGVCIWLTHDLKVKDISKRQAVAELLVETANKFVIGNMGEKFRHMIPFVAALFITSVVSNLISLIGLRSPTADLSTEAAMGCSGICHDHWPEDKNKWIWRLSERFYNADSGYDSV